MSESALWVIFLVIFAVLMAVDLFGVDRGEKKISAKMAGRMVLLYVAVALLFGVLIYFELGGELAASYYAAYVIELSMSVDNLFVFIIIFAAFLIPSEDQHRVLFWGIMGAIVFRALFVFVGAELLDTFDWMLYVFGVILIVTALKTAFSKDKDKKEEDSLAYKISKHIPATTDRHGGKFIAIENGKRLATPLLLCLVVIELSDIMFAFDSIPAALSITTDVFIVFSSNIFAVMGLRTMYFVIRGALGSLVYLKYGLGVILAFIGIKMLISDFYEIDVFMSLLFIIAVLAITVVASLYKSKKGAVKPPEQA